MTRLADSRKVVRETSAFYRRRALVIEAGPHELVLREKGRRQRVAVPYTVILETGYKLLALERAKEKKAAKGPVARKRPRY